MFCSVAAVLIPIDYFEIDNRQMPAGFEYARAFERFDQRQIAVD
jgi:hypothetical protein